MTTLGEYMLWLKEQGGRCQTGHAADHTRGYVPVTKLIAPDGKRYVIHGGNNQTGKLLPETIELFDSRLGMLSPFRSTPRA